MSVEVITGNHAAGYALSVAGEANRSARGVACGIYPITPQTEIVERVAAFPFSKGKVVAVESEHSAMGVTLGASLAGARSIRLRMSDDFSGIATFEGRVDGEWVLFAYDPKNTLIEHRFDGRVSRGSHVLEVRATDGVGNTTTYRAQFTR